MSHSRALSSSLFPSLFKALRPKRTAQQNIHGIYVLLAPTHVPHVLDLFRAVMTCINSRVQKLIQDRCHWHWKRRQFHRRSYSRFKRFSTSSLYEKRYPFRFYQKRYRLTANENFTDIRPLMSGTMPFVHLLLWKLHRLTAKSSRN